MSSGLNCIFKEFEPNKWFYILEEGSAPKNAWDWREYAEAFGPFESYEVAHKHLHSNHPNPGGHSVFKYNPKDEMDEVEEKLLADAPQNMKRCRHSAWDDDEDEGDFS